MICLPENSTVPCIPLKSASKFTARNTAHTSDRGRNDVFTTGIWVSLPGNEQRPLQFFTCKLLLQARARDGKSLTGLSGTNSQKSHACPNFACALTGTSCHHLLSHLTASEGTGSMLQKQAAAVHSAANSALTCMPYMVWQIDSRCCCGSAAGPPQNPWVTSCTAADNLCPRMTLLLGSPPWGAGVQSPE
jgi:hypothetical protein